MHRKIAGIAFGVFAVAMSAAQTNVTTTNGGTANTVPVFTTSSNVENSPISVSGSNVGIGTVYPSFSLEVIGELVAGGWYAGQSGAVGFMGPAGAGSWFWIDNPGLSGNYLRISSGNTPGQAPLVVIENGGNVGIGTTNPQYTLDVVGQIHSSTGGYVFPDGTTQTTAFIPANCGADYAESVGVSGDRTKYEPGDLLVIDPDHPGKFLKSNQPYSTMVAGVYSTKPGFVGRKQPASDPASKDEVPMAMVGRVPAKVSAENGPIHVGDLLVSSSTMGYAMKGTDRNQMMGAVVGKALGSLDSGTGVIEVLVTLQ